MKSRSGINGEFWKVDWNNGVQEEALRAIWPNVFQQESGTFESSLDELSCMLDHLVREFAATNNQHRRMEIATRFSELTARFSAIKFAISGYLNVL